MENLKKYRMEMVSFLVSIIVFFLIFRNWDHIKEFIANLF